MGGGFVRRGDVITDIFWAGTFERVIVRVCVCEQELDSMADDIEPVANYRKADKELDDIEKQIQERKDNAARLVGTQDDAICQICQKTKFADGIGHKCFYCQLRSCARCGGRTTNKNKVRTPLCLNVSECVCMCVLLMRRSVRLAEKNLPPGVALVATGANGGASRRYH